MKKIKLLTPIFGLAVTASVALPVASCSCSKENPIPTDLLNIEGTTLKGLKEGVDISKYNTLSIPSNVETIGENAFYGVFTLLNKISKVIISNSVKTIKASAFEYCYGVSVFDFSSFSRDQINAITIEKNAFGKLDNYEWYANVVFNQDWKDETITTDKFKGKLSDAGVPHYWFVQATTGHLEYNNVTDQLATNGYGHVTLQLLENHQDNYIYTPVVSKVDGTSGVTVFSDEQATYKKEKKNIDFNTQMLYLPGQEPKETDWVSYKVTVFCSIGTSVQWVQHVQIYKSTYTKAPHVPVQSILFNLSKNMKVGDEVVPEIEFNPASATNKNYTLTSSDPTIVEVQYHKLVALKPGTVTITATSEDGGKTHSCTTTVVA